LLHRASVANPPPTRDWQPHGAGRGRRRVCNRLD